MDENPAIAMSFRNQFVPSINYTYTFERTYGATGNRRFYWQNSVTSAGNILSGVLRSLFGEKTAPAPFGNRFFAVRQGGQRRKFTTASGAATTGWRRGSSSAWATPTAIRR